ncbi:CBS domain-containing protein [Desulfoprunum benzoelyticum]|uniref:Acetoin utilization protein AcuB n=1 Tax=Desulfoprunum benzoelyticum TaxID=1506996 RepID=A0A840UVV1_9BACT|nr:CBS domain-containing protein [Desulfoprunum benzoelyticum]MBB5346848.1 acetoin utilization protein AcuB [Desulfoprunum benzoelyticum]MBM9529490.1 CBS domain-containing protein [Desulfoprunum benzoelyticum]
MFVSERMAKKLITVRPDTLLSEVRDLMVQHNIRHLPVVDGEGLLVGIISDRDMRAALPSSLLGREAYERALERVITHRAEEIMTANPLTISVYYTIQDTLLMMRQKRVGAFPVIDENGYLKGILSTRDLLSSLANVMGIGEPGTLLCILARSERGQLKKIVDIVTEEKIRLGSVLVSRTWDVDKKAIFPYLLTNNVARVKKRLLDAGFELFDPMQWYLDNVSKNPDLLL